jgi:thiamine kinase-like enzyme
MTATKAHQRMYEQMHILHRDISFRNIMIYDDKEKHPGERRGLLIDFDYGATAQDSANDIGEHPNHRSVSHRRFNSLVF